MTRATRGDDITLLHALEGIDCSNLEPLILRDASGPNAGGSGPNSDDRIHRIHTEYDDANMERPHIPPP
jgi:hypothetical protein